MGKPLRYQTAGESHGPALVAILDGLPSDLAVDAARVNAELSRRQGGYGRGARQQEHRGRERDEDDDEQVAPLVQVSALPDEKAYRRV